MFEEKREQRKIKHFILTAQMIVYQNNQYYVYLNIDCDSTRHRNRQGKDITSDLYSKFK